MRVNLSVGDEKMGLVNEVSTIQEDEKIVRSKSIFDGWKEEDMGYLLHTGKRIISYTANKPILTGNMQLWYTSVWKAKVYCLRLEKEKHERVLNGLKTKQENRLLAMKELEEVRDKAVNMMSKQSYLNTLQQGIDDCIRYARIQKRQYKNETTIPFYPFNTSLGENMHYKLCYFRKYLQNYGG